MTNWKNYLRSRAYHEAGHAVAARCLGLYVEYSTIDDEVKETDATKTVSLKDYFDEHALIMGRLKRRDKKKIERTDYRLFYSILLQKLCGYVALELAGFDLDRLPTKHYDEDRALALNVLNHIEKGKAEERYEKMQRIARRLLERRWNYVERLVEMLLKEITVYFHVPDLTDRGEITG
jgi:hypothetical protein